MPAPAVPKWKDILYRLFFLWVWLLVIMFIGYMTLAFFGQLDQPAITEFPPVPFLEGPEWVTTTTRALSG